jgi:hypothetical protein
MRRMKRPAGILALTLFFYLATVLTFAAALSLLEPGTALDSLWKLNPIARETLDEMTGWAIPLFFLVSAASAVAAAGLWIRRPWGRHVAVGILVLNMLGDFGNVFFRGDERALVGLPIAGILTAYLMSARAKRGEPVREEVAVSAS